MYRGSKRGLVHDYGKMEVPFHGHDGFNEIDDQGSPPDVSKVKDGAVGAILKIVRENPGQVKVIALGPLTNVAGTMIFNHLWWWIWIPYLSGQFSKAKTFPFYTNNG